MCDRTVFMRTALWIMVLFLFSSMNVSYGKITVEGVSDKQVYANAVTFRVPAEAGYDITATLNGESAAVGADVRVDQPDYYELYVVKRNTATQNQETLLIRFIVKDSSRGDSEWGLAPWTPYPDIPSAAAEFAGATLHITMPRSYPAGLPIPVVAWVRRADGRRVGVNGRVMAAEFPDTPITLTRGVGYAFLPSQPAGASVPCNFAIHAIAASKQVDIDAHTAWTVVSGSITQNTTWPEDSRVHITGALEIKSGVTLTVGAGSVIELAPGVEITVTGKIIANGTSDHPVSFMPEDRSKPWGGMLLHIAASEITMTATILTGSGADADWFDTHTNTGFSHRREECLFHMTNGARATFTDSAIISHAGQAGHGENSYLTLTNSLVAECTTGGEYNGGAVNVAHSALISFPYIGAPFEDNDNDGLYLTGGAHTITDSLIGWALDDGIDAGSGNAGSVKVTDSWFESCYHEGMAWSESRDADVAGTVAINNGQGIECGFGNPNVLAVQSLATGNMVGARFGDNYTQAHSGAIEVHDSILVYNERDIWGMNWSDWTYRISQMNFHDNYLSAPNTNHPNNTIWDPLKNAESLAPFLPAPDAVVGVGIAFSGNLVEAGLASQGVPVRLSAFSRQAVSVDYLIRSNGKTLGSGTLTFPPGQTVMMIPTQNLDLTGLGVVKVTIKNPVHADVTGVAAVTLYQDVVLIAENAQWRYNDTGVAPASDWMQPGFNDSTWPSGPAELGFGDGDEATVIHGGPSGNHYPAVYFRRSFIINDPSDYDRLIINLRRDDGGVVYLNGQEVFRSNMPAGKIAFNTWASSATTSETAFYTAEIDAAPYLAPAGNVIAVEVHQSDASSTDLSFALTLAGRPAFIDKSRQTVDLDLSAGGAMQTSTAGDSPETQAGYATVSVNSGEASYGTAVFSFKQAGVTVSEAGVPASPPTTSARVFIDYRSNVNAVPARSDAGVVDINTGIAAINYGTATANVTYTLRDTTGGTLAAGHGTIAAGQHISRFIDQLNDIASDFTLPSYFQTAVQFGVLDIASTQPLSVLALRGTYNQKQQFIFTTTPVADLTQSAGNAPIYFAQLGDGGGYTTSLILINTSTASETGTLGIMDNNGSALLVNQVGGSYGSSFRYAIPPNGTFHFQTDGSPAHANVGWVQLTPDSGTSTPVGSGVFGYNSANVLVTESGVPSASATTHARIYVDQSNSHDTGLAIANINHASATLTIHAFQTDGSTPAGTSNGPLALNAYGHDSAFAGKYIAGLPAGFTGILDISSMTPFAALTMRSLYNESSDYLMTTFPVAEMNQTAPSPTVFPHIADGGGYITQFILLSAGGASTTTIRYYDGNGAPLAVGIEP
jgi:hypothetical protein